MVKDETVPQFTLERCPKCNHAKFEILNYDDSEVWFNCLNCGTSYDSKTRRKKQGV